MPTGYNIETGLALNPAAAELVSQGQQVESSLFITEKDALTT